jgi:hypothetical protein
MNKKCRGSESEECCKLRNLPAHVYQSFVILADNETGYCTTVLFVMALEIFHYKVVTNQTFPKTIEISVN